MRCYCAELGPCCGEMHEIARLTCTFDIMQVVEVCDLHIGVVQLINRQDVGIDEVRWAELAEMSDSTAGPL